MATETGTPGPRLPPGPGPDESTPKRDGRIGRRPESNGKRPSPLDILSNLDRKRTASQMEDSGDTYDATHIHFPIKKEPGLPIDESPSSSGSTSPSSFPIKQKLSTGKVLQGHSIANGNSGATKFGPSPRLDDSFRMVKKEADWLDHHARKASNSSSLTEQNMWDVSESEIHTSELEEESSDGESVGSVFSLGMERQESVKSEKSSRGPDDLHREESDDIPSRRETVQDQNYVSRARSTEPATNGSNRTEQNTPGSRISHNHDNHTRDESNAIPANGVTGRNSETTVTGKPRQRAAPKAHISMRDISRSWKAANPADKMLMKMKLRGCSWLEIRKAWEELTGEWPAASTLPNRYKRVKDNLTRLKSGDGQRLLDAVAEVEAQFQHSKWRLIAEAMERTGAAKYSNAFIQKKCEELSRNGTLSGSLIDDESSDTSESDSGPQEGMPSEDSTSRLRQPEAGSTTATSQRGSPREIPP